MEQSFSLEANRFSASQEIPAFYGTRKFITAFTSACHLSLSWANSMHSMTPHSTYWRSILILSSRLCLGFPSRLFLSRFHTKTLLHPAPPPYALHAQPISFFSIWSSKQYWMGVQIIKLFIKPSSPLPCYFVPLRPKYPPQYPRAIMNEGAKRKNPLPRWHSMFDILAHN